MTAHQLDSQPVAAWQELLLVVREEIIIYYSMNTKLFLGIKRKRDWCWEHNTLIEAKGMQLFLMPHDMVYPTTKNKGSIYKKNKKEEQRKLRNKNEWINECMHWWRQWIFWVQTVPVKGGNSSQRHDTCWQLVIYIHTQNKY